MGVGAPAVWVALNVPSFEREARYAMHVLQPLQYALEGLHDVQTQLDVHAFVVDDTVRCVLPGAKPHVPEQLFVQQDQDGMDVALYIAPHVLDGLARDPPHARLHDGNAEHYWIALEGVSHFVFLAWCSHAERSVTALELEVQAEVDKFVVSWLLLADQGKPLHRTAEGLLKRLFSSFVLHDGMSQEEVARYQTANRAAHAYCMALVARYGRDKDPQRIRGDVRSFYRQGLSVKLSAL